MIVFLWRSHFDMQPDSTSQRHIVVSLVRDHYNVKRLMLTAHQEGQLSIFVSFHGALQGKKWKLALALSSRLLSRGKSAAVAEECSEGVHGRAKRSRVWSVFGSNKSDQARHAQVSPGL